MGASLEPDGRYARFRLRSSRATRVEVLVFSEPFGSAAVRTAVLDLEVAGGVFRARLPVHDLVGPIYYGYRVWGPNWPYDPSWEPGSEAGRLDDVDADGNRFNPNKLLIDPYARELSHDPVTETFTDYGVYRTGDADRARDSAPFAPKGLVLAVETEPTGVHPARPFKDGIIYEVHLRGLTMGAAEVGECRGTYAGAAARAAYLEALGVTAIELLPVQETPNDANDREVGTGGDNYWGYSTLAFFAPDRRYACDRSPGGPTREFRAMVRAFHERGIEVYLDVVYNHTSEGGGSALLSLRGVDNAGYYQLDASGRGFTDNTGIGANTNATSPLLHALVLDSLRYWSEEMGVDGFRFDLAAVLGNRCERGCFEYDGDDPNGLLRRIAAELPDVDLIAEPWGIGAGTYQIGSFPPGWAEWNDHFRDLVRRDQNRLDVEAVTPGSLANRVSGSPDLFGDDGRKPWHSVNYVVSHDGFTLRDLHACNAKRNDQPWPYGPSNGGDDHNLSWDHGGAPDRQRQAVRTSLALMMLSAGVPMITGGDELFRTQHCNNNPYNLDSNENWLDWSNLDTHAMLATFAGRLMRFRRAHPALSPEDYRTDRIRWYRADGTVANAAYLDDPTQHVLAWRIDGVATGDSARSIYVAYTGDDVPVRLTLPAAAAGHAWFRWFDTGAWMEPYGNGADPGQEYRMNGATYDLEARALAVFVEQQLPAGQ